MLYSLLLTCVQKRVRDAEHRAHASTRRPTGLIEKVDEALNVDLAVHKACYASEAVKLNAMYKPFHNSIFAESEDELYALHDIAIIQEHLLLSHAKVDAWQVRLDQYERELLLPGTSDNAEHLRECKLNLNFLYLAAYCLSSVI